MLYQVIRIFFKNENRSNSIEYFDNILQAQQRFHNIIAADLSNNEITYQATYIIDNTGYMVDKAIFNRQNEEGEN